MKAMHTSFRNILWAVVAGAALAACNDSVAVVGPDGGTDTDTDTDADTDTDTDTDTDADETWEGVALLDVGAPDEFTVIVGFSGAPPAADAGNAAIYALDSDVGALAVESVTYDAAEHVATLATAKQKLGITYTLTVTPPPDSVAPLQDDFLSADTATFWVIDWNSYAYEQILATRSTVGTRGVAYIQQGFAAWAADAVQNFDDNVYPIETTAFIDAPDMDGNGKIVILGADCGGYCGGWFDPINTYTEEQAQAYGYHSNAMEIIHIAVEWGDFDSGHATVPHEFQHLLYQERHPNNDYVTDIYHNEGLAECAILLVNGDYPQGVDYYFGDYSGIIGGGLSLVDWVTLQAESYVLSFMFWSYVASQLGGVDGLSEIFDLDSGAPDEVESFFVDALGTDFGETQRNQLIATFVQAETGVYGYEGILDLEGQLPPHVGSGTNSVDLEPFAGTFFLLAQASVTYPGTQGANIVYAGITDTGAVDLEAPFNVDGGALMVLNTNLEFEEFPTEHSGPDVAASGGKFLEVELGSGAVSPTWTNPPPAVFTHPELMERWRAARERQLGIR